MLTKIDLCTMALLKLGEAPIQSLMDASPAAQLARTLFDSIIDSLIAIHPWRFATASIELNRDSNGDFIIPVDCLRIIKCGAEVRGNKIISSSDTMNILALKRVPVESFPSYFVSLAATRLAMEFCIPLSGDTSVFKMLATLYDRELQSAKFIDSTTSIGIDIDDFSLVNSRF